MERRRTLGLGVTVLGIVGWVFIGAAIGYHAAPRRGFSRTTGVVSGAPAGVLAVVLYFSEAGRWLSEDPIDCASGDANLYRYVSNHPVNHVDPFGLETQQCTRPMRRVPNARRLPPHTLLACA